MVLSHSIARAGKRLLRRVPAPVYQATYHAFDATLPLLLRRVRRGGDPIVLGPWTAEIGQELAHWIPFLERLRRLGHIDPERTIAVSRGGNAGWYRRLARRYYNVFWDLPPAQFRAELARWRTGKLEKRLKIDGLDRQVLDRAAAHFGVQRYRVLHPWMMNVLFMPIWRGRLSPSLELRHLAYARFVDEPMPLPDLGLPIEGPRELVAVKFHYSGNFPDTTANVAFVDRTIAALAERYTVLLLQLRQAPDNHAFPTVRTSNPHVIDCGDIPLVENLRYQTELIRRAKYTVSTLGGLAYLPPYFGGVTYGFYSGAYNSIHDAVANRLFDALSPGNYHVIDSETFDPATLP